MAGRTLRLWVARVLAVCLAFVPALPAFAGAPTAHERPAHAGHEHHLAAEAAMPGGASTYEHDCDDQCCLACTMQLIETVALVCGDGSARPPQIATIRHYRPYALVAPPERPPRQLS